MMVPRNRERKDDVTLPTFYKSNISILKNTNPDESLCNCHEVNNDQDLVINPYINYSSLSHRNHGRNQNQNNQNQNQSNQNQNHFHHSRQEPIYQNQHEIQNQNSQVYPIYSVVNKRNKNVRIMLENDNVDKFSGETDTETNNTESNTETEEEIENEEDQRCLTPSNTYLELSFEHRGAGSPLNLGAIPKVNNLYKDLVHHSTPNNNDQSTGGSTLRQRSPNSTNNGGNNTSSTNTKVRTITQV